MKDLRPSEQSDRIDLSQQNSKPQPRFFYRKPQSGEQLRDLSGKIPKIKTNDIPHHRPPKYFGDLLRIAFFGLIVILILTAISAFYSTRVIKQQVEEKAKEGIGVLVTAGQNLSAEDFSSAIKSFNQARAIFQQAEKQLWFLSRDKSIYLRDAELTYAMHSLIEGAAYFADSGDDLLQALEEFNKIPLYFVNQNEGLITDAPAPFTAIQSGLEHSEKALKTLALATAKINQINPAVLPLQIQTPLLLTKNHLQKIQTNLEQITNYFPEIQTLLGAEKPHRYMILLQNNDELRATGGFIGSYALFQIDQAVIQNLAVHDVYDLKSNQNNTPLPTELQGLFNQPLYFRDANYSPDFPTSAEILYQSYLKEGGEPVDTIIAINQGLLPDLLNITGPVQVGDFGQFTAANYNLLLTAIIESKIWGAEDPKHILKVFIPAFQKALLKEQNLSKIATKLYRAIHQKHIFLYSRNPKIQELFDFANLSGRVRQAKNEDYLQIIHTSIGSKSDKLIEEKIDHKTTISKKGEIIDELTLSRKHLFSDQLLTDWQNLLKPYGLNLSPAVIDVLGRGTNKTLTRIYVPTGTKLLETSNPAITQHHDKTLNKDYFKVQIDTSAGQTSTLKIRYQLPEKIHFDGGVGAYKIYIAKQPGSRGSFLNKIIESPSLDLIRSYPENFNTNLTYDRYFSTLWKK